MMRILFYLTITSLFCCTCLDSCLAKKKGLKVSKLAVKNITWSLVWWITALLSDSVLKSRACHMMPSRASCLPICQGPWPHPMRRSLNWSITWPHAQHKAQGGLGKTEMASHNFRINSAWGMAKSKLGRFGTAESATNVFKCALSLTEAFCLH